MVLYHHPSRDGYLGEEEDNLAPSTARSRHISLQSRVDSIAFESIYGDTERQERDTDHLAPYEDPRNERSTNLLLVPDYIRPLSTAYVKGATDIVDYHHQPPSSGPAPQQPLGATPLHEAMFVGVAVMAQFMALAGLGQTISPQLIIADALGARNPGEYAWFTAAYSFMAGTFILIAGRVGDILGHKCMLVFGYFFLGVWSGFAGFSV